MRIIGWVMACTLAACGGKKAEHATHEECLRLMDYEAEMLVKYFVAHPDELWDGVHANQGDPGIPATVTKATFAQFLASPEAKPWLDKRRNQARAGLGAQIDPCMTQSKQWLDCMMHATKPDDGARCDREAR